MPVWLWIDFKTLLYEFRLLSEYIHWAEIFLWVCINVHSHMHIQACIDPWSQNKEHRAPTAETTKWNLA